MKTWGLETEIAILLFVVTLPLIIAPLVYGHFRRFGRWHGWPAVVMLGTIFYGCGVVAFTMFPLPTITPDFCEKHESLRHWNWGGILPDVHPRADQSPMAPTIRRRVVAGYLDVVVVTLVAAFAELVVAVLYRRSGGEFGGDLPAWFAMTEQIVGIVLAPIVLFLLFPMMRKDGATVGQVCVFLRPARIDGGKLETVDLLKKGGSRWLPWMILAFLMPVGVAFPALILMELGTAFARPDRRSLSSVFSSTKPRDSRDAS